MTNNNINIYTVLFFAIVLSIGIITTFQLTTPRDYGLSYAATMEIPTYTFDDSQGYGFVTNGTRMFDYDATKAAEENGNKTLLPYKNGTILVDLTYYADCAKGVRPQVIADANIEGTNVPTNQKNLEDSVAMQLDMCISFFGSTGESNSSSPAETLKTLAGMDDEL